MTILHYELRKIEEITLYVTKNTYQRLKKYNNPSNKNKNLIEIFDLEKNYNKIKEDIIEHSYTERNFSDEYKEYVSKIDTIEDNDHDKLLIVHHNKNQYLLNDAYNLFILVHIIESEYPFNKEMPLKSKPTCVKFSINTYNYIKSQNIYNDIKYEIKITNIFHPHKYIDIINVKEFQRLIPNIININDHNIKNELQYIENALNQYHHAQYKYCKIVPIT